MAANDALIQEKINQLQDILRVKNVEMTECRDRLATLFLIQDSEKTTYDKKGKPIVTKIRKMDRRTGKKLTDSDRDRLYHEIIPEVTKIISKENRNKSS